MVFHTLKPVDIESIVDIQLREVRMRLDEMGLSLTLSDEAHTLISESGYDPRSGARHLRRAIQRLVEDPLTDALLRGRFVPGDDIRAVRRAGELVFVKGDGDADRQRHVATTSGSKTK